MCFPPKITRIPKIFIDALDKGNFKAVQKLLDIKPDLIFYKGLGYLSPLWLAVTSGYPEIVELLVKLGANIHEQYMSETFLTWLVKSAETEEHVKLLKFFLEHGADVNARCPLHHAIRQGKVRYTELLLNYGATMDNGPRPSLFVAATSSKPAELIQLLVKHKVDVRKCRFGKNILHCLSSELMVDLDVVKLLIDQGASLDEFDSLGYTPLHYATQKNREPLIELFLKYRADANKLSTITKESPLYIAAGVENSATINLLIDEGAIVNLIAKTGQTALHKACKSQIQANILTLLERGARANVLDIFGRSPFSLLDINDQNMPMIKSVIRRFAQMQLEGEPLCPGDLKTIEENLVLQKYYQECLDELTAMKGVKFYGYFSIYDIVKFWKDKKKVARLMKNEEFLAGFESCNLMTVIRHYAKDLYNILDAAVTIKFTLVKMENELDKIIGDRLPAFPKYIILKYLKPRDML